MTDYYDALFCDATPLDRVLDRLPQALRAEFAKRDILRVGQLYAEWKKNGLDWVSSVQGVGLKAISKMTDLCGECERREREREERKAEASSSIDWEQRRYEIARNVLAARAANSSDYLYKDEMGDEARDAVEIADALIAELKKSKK